MLVEPKKDGRNGRRNSLLHRFINKSCQYCGESEQVALMFYPHHRKIRSLNLRHGKKHKAQEQIQKLISECDIRCWNCAIKASYDLSLGVEF